MGGQSGQFLVESPVAFAKLVLEAVERLNYSPNTASRSLASGEATHIGLLYANRVKVGDARFHTADAAE